jgi:hypothetical protein
VFFVVWINKPRHLGGVESVRIELSERLLELVHVDVICLEGKLDLLPDLGKSQRWLLFGQVTAGLLSGMNQVHGFRHKHLLGTKRSVAEQRLPEYHRAAVVLQIKNEFSPPSKMIAR